MKIDEALDIVDKVISDNIQQCAVLGRGFASQNILAQMRNLVELVSLKAFLQGENAEVDYCLIKKANAHVKGKGDLAFLGRFHKLLQVSASHYTLDQGNSERLMLKYYEYLLRIRLHLQETYGISVLGNLDEYPLDLDPAFSEYHCKIAEEVERMTLAGVGTLGSSRYRLYKVKPFFNMSRTLSRGKVGPGPDILGQALSLSQPSCGDLGVSFRRSSLQFNIRPWRTSALGNPLLRLGLPRRNDSLCTRVAPAALAKKETGVRPNGLGFGRRMGWIALCRRGLP